MDILIIGGTGVLSSAVVNVALKQGLKSDNDKSWAKKEPDSRRS